MIDNQKQIEILKELLLASLDIHNLKPHVGQLQLDAANRIQTNINNIFEIIKKC